MKFLGIKPGFPYRIKISGRTHEWCMYKVQEKEFKLDGWNGDYPIYKATTTYGNEEVYFVHDYGLLKHNYNNEGSLIKVRLN